MSFSMQLKKEICQNRNFLYPRKEAVCFGLLLFGRSLNEKSVSLYTESLPVSRLYSEMIYEVVDIQTSITAKEQILGDDRKLFCVTVDSEEDRLSVLKHFASLYRRFQVCDAQVEQDFLYGVLCGAFLSCSNISDPRKSYHLEFVVHNDDACDAMCELLDKLAVHYRLTARKGVRLVYVKSSEAIEEVLTMLGAGKTALEIMNVKIYKDIRNKVNRITNCETANIDRTVLAAAHQIASIRLIESTNGIRSLPEGLREIARLRLQEPDMPLTELARSLSPPISRSGVNYRLRQLCEIADKLKTNDKRKLEITDAENA